MTVTRTVILTSGTTWRVPNTWNNLDNTVICIGAGAGGSSNGGGGGGGAYASSSNLTLTPYNLVSILIGAGGGANLSGGYTSFSSNTVMAQGGRANTSTSGSWAVGGLGGQAADSIGNVKFNGGNGGNGSLTFNGGGGGGAGGNTAAGSNGSNGIVSSPSAGKGGNAGATDGGDGGAGGNGTDGTRGYAGWPWPNESTSYGNNYAGGGGGGASYATGEGTTYFAAGPGGNFGGGGGGGHSVGGGAGTGANGAIIIKWNYESRLPPSGAFSMSNVAISLDITPNNQLSMNDTRVRDLFRSTPTETQISFSSGVGKVANGIFVATNNTTGTGSSIPLPTGWQAGDLAVLFIVNADGVAGNATVTTAGWTYLGPNTRTVTALNYTTGAFSRILQSGDSDAGPTIIQTSGGAYMIAFRNASYARGIAQNAAAGTTCTFPAITKDNDSKKLLSFVADRNIAQNGTAPTGWTEHTRVQLTNFVIECASVNSASHIDGTDIVWTGFEATYQNQGILIEIT